MPKMTIRIPEDLKHEVNKHKEINWSEVARKSMWQFLKKLELADSLVSDSELMKEEAKELSQKVKHDIAEHYR